MAEGLIGGVLGVDEEKLDAEASESPASAEAFASAVAAKLAGNDPQVARDTSAFLRKQAQLLDTQNKYLQEEHALRMSHLRGQSREGALRRTGMRLRLGFQVFTSLLATGIGIGLVVMLHDAITSRSVVIDPFEVPQSLASDGLNGRVVAAGLLDVLTRIQAASRGPIEHRNLTNAWTSEISVEVPDTGISLKELERIVKTRFGHDQHIEGDLVRIERGGLALTVRGSGILPQTFTGEAGTLNKLLTQAGEYLFSQSQPGLWVAYLTSVARDDEAIEFAQKSYNAVDPSERPYVLNGWANAITDQGAEGAVERSLRLYQEAVRLKPDYWVAYNNIMFAMANLGDEEGALQVGEQMIKSAGGRPGRASENIYQNYDEMVWDLPSERASNLEDMESHGGVGSTTVASGAENLIIATLDIRMHDLAAAARRVDTTKIDGKNIADVASLAMVRALIAEEAGDPQGAVSAWDEFRSAYSNPLVYSYNPPFICSAAVSYEKTGQSAKANAALRPTGGRTYTSCYRFSGDVLDLRGDWRGAQEWYGKAVKLAPSLPAGYYSWGVALAKHGDLAGAAEKLALANQKGPHWADPLKAWGDVLLKQGKSREALAKYDEARKYAPNWKLLKEARESVSQHPSSS